MIVQVEPIHLWWLFVIGTFLVTAAGALGRWLVAQAQQKTDAQIELLLEDSKRWSDIEAKLVEHRIEAAECYVRREDYIRGQTVVETKIDRVFAEVENLRLQAAMNGGGNHEHR